MKSAVVRWKQKGVNPKRQRPPMRLDNVVEVGEGPHFIHIFLDGSEMVKEANFHHDQIESVTVFDTPEMPESPLVGADGKPIGDEAQSEEQLPVEQKDAGATPVVPAI